MDQLTRLRDLTLEWQLRAAIQEFATKHGISLEEASQGDRVAAGVELDEVEDVDPATELSHQARYHLGGEE